MHDPWGRLFLNMRPMERFAAVSAIRALYLLPPTAMVLVSYFWSP
jgi:hypothetical protein